MLGKELNLDSVDRIVDRLVKARERGIHLVVVWRPDKSDDGTEEAYPDWIGCNFEDPKLAAALLGRAEDATEDSEA